VIASAGFGAVFAYRIGIEHSYLLAGLTVLFAVTLEGIKPLAINAAFQSLGAWPVIRGLCLALLGLVAVAYSLTSELALMAASRGDLAAHRAAESFAAQSNRDRHQRAKQELDSLKPTKPVAELEALRKSWHQRMGKNDPWFYEPELARTKRRLELEAVLRTNTSIAPKIADPAATLLVTYLAALGITASVEVVATWLNLVPVLALELGSALAVVLVASVAPRSLPETTVTLPVSQVISPEKPAPGPPVTRETATERDRVASQIMSHLRANGGSARGSYRALGKMLAADRNTVGRALNSLAAAGLIALEASRQGSLLKLM